MNPGTRPLIVTRPSFRTSNSRADQTGSISHVPEGITTAFSSATIDIACSFAFATIEYTSNVPGILLMSQVLSDQSTGVRAFAALLRAHAASTRVLNAQLLADHGLTLSDYEVLLRLAWSPDRRMRRVDLAEEVLLTASGITRLLDGLEKAGYVERGTCDSDRRVVYAVLTEAGLTKLRGAVDEPRRAGRGALRGAIRRGRARDRGRSPLPSRRNRLARLRAGRRRPRRRGSSASSGSASGRAGPGTSSRFPPTRTGARPAPRAGRTRSARSSSRGRS